MVQKTCREELGIDGRYDDVIAYMRNSPEEYYLRRQRVAGRLPALYAEEVDRLRHQKRNGWSNVIERYKTEVVPRQQAAARRDMAKRLLALAESFGINPLVLADAPSNDLKQLIEWMEAFPESDHGPVWLKALEAGYQEGLLGEISTSYQRLTAGSDPSSMTRPYSQSVYCIDVTIRAISPPSRVDRTQRDLWLRRLLRRVHSLSGLGQGT